MLVSAMAAVDRSGLIGDGKKMPWHLPRDLRRFRKYTTGKPVIMGRRTFESIGRPLPGRLNIVLTRDRSFGVAGCHVVGSVDEAMRAATEDATRSGIGEAVVIGGGVVFAETAHLWGRCLLTVVDGDFRGDTYFPLGIAGQFRWDVVGREYCQADADNVYPYCFLTLERVGDCMSG